MKRLGKYVAIHGQYNINLGWGGYIKGKICVMQELLRTKYELTYTKLEVKSVSKVRGQLCDSRKLNIASVTIIQRAGNSTPQIKYAKSTGNCLLVWRLTPSGGHFWP